MSNKLVEIPLEKWAHLRDLYRDGKERVVCYNTIQTFINWISQEPNYPLKIYSLNGEWEVDGTYVAETFNQLFCSTLSDDWTRLVDALNCFDSSKLVAGFPERLVPAVEKHFLDLGLKKEQFMLTGTFWYHIQKDEALNFDTEPPQNIAVKSLDQSHAEQVNRIWPHRSDGSVAFVEALIRLNESVGLFEDNQLAAWCLRLPLGSLGLLQVEDSYKRRGLGKLAVRTMSKLLAERGIEVTAPVVFANVASRSMFEHLGFKKIDNVYWAFKVANE